MAIPGFEEVRVTEQLTDMLLRSTRDLAAMVQAQAVHLGERRQPAEAGLAFTEAREFERQAEAEQRKLAALTRHRELLDAELSLWTEPGQA